METVSSDAWFEWIVKGQWRTRQDVLLALLGSSSPGLKTGITDEEGKTALHHLLLQTLTPEALEENIELLDALSSCGLSPWQPDRAGRRAYQELIQQQACSEVLMWCWTRSMEPGHVEVDLSSRIASDRLDWVLGAHPIAGSVEQTHWRRLYGLSLDRRWASGATTLRRLLQASPRPDEGSSPGMVFQGLASLMRECTDLPCFADEHALLGVWGAHAHGFPPPGSLAALAEQWKEQLLDKCHARLPDQETLLAWGWQEWRQWVGERSGSPVWAGYAALAACRVAQERADTQGLETARALLLEGLVDAMVLWEPNPAPDAWPLYAWGHAWELAVRWSVLSELVWPEMWALVLPLAQRPDVARWLREQAVLPPLPPGLSPAWERWAAENMDALVGGPAGPW